MPLIADLASDAPIVAIGCDHCRLLCLASDCRACLCSSRRRGRAHIACQECITLDAVGDDQLGDLLLDLT